MTLSQTTCDICEVTYIHPLIACDRCQHPAPHFSSVDRVAIDIQLDHPALLLVTVSVHYCAACDHYFRAQPPFLRPDAVYTNRVVTKAVEAVYQDRMAMRRVPDRLARDFWVAPCEGSVRQWCRSYQSTFDFTTDYQPWVVRQFSGILCVDEVYQHQLALLIAVDPAAPDGDRLVGYQLVHGDVNSTLVESFLTQLSLAGIQPDEVITDGSELYPAVLARVWPAAAHQLCLFHETRRVTAAVMEVIQSVRKSLPTPPPQPKRRWGGPLYDHPPTDNPADLTYRRWQLRRATRQAGIAQVHGLARRGMSQRAIARQLSLHRRTVKRWLQLDPPAEVDHQLAENWRQRTLSDVTTMRREQRETRHTQVRTLAHQGLSHSAIARQVGIHRVTVKNWLERDRLANPDVQSSAANESEEMTTSTVSAADTHPAILAAPAEADVNLPSAEMDSSSPAPPAPWANWDQVHEVREALRKHRFLLLRRPEHLDAEQRAQVDALLTSPVGPQLRVARAFLEEWYRMWTDEQKHRQPLEEARTRCEAWRSNLDYAAIPALKRIQERMTDSHFERLSQFLRHSTWEATNNGAERTGRAFRHRQAPHFNLRGQATIEGALVVAACQQKATATAPPNNRDVSRCWRGRKRRNGVPGAIV